MDNHSHFNVLTCIPPIIVGIFMLPVVLGLAGTWLPAFGYFPAIGMNSLSFSPWIALKDYPGFQSAVCHTLITGLGGSFLALTIVALLLIGSYPSRIFSVIEKTLSPLLSVPHAAFAIGAGFLLTPSGWFIRLFNNIGGWFPTPPLWTIFQDPNGISLIIVLALKEIPFLLLMCLAVLPSLNVSKTLWLSKSMGHNVRFAWLWLLFPPLYKQIKLPFFAVVAFSLTVVDVAKIAGPTTPSTLAVLVTQLFNDPDIQLRTVGAAGATYLLLLVLLTLTAIHLCEPILRKVRSYFIQQGRHRFSLPSWEKTAATLFFNCLLLTYFLSTLVTIIWSVTQRWRFPEILPSEWSTKPWQRVLNRIDDPFWCTFELAILSASIALILVVLALENEVRLRWKNPNFNSNKTMWLIYLPLLIPQVAFLFGFQVVLIQLGWDAHFLSLLWSHLVFVLPYTFLTLSGPYRQFDDRYFWQALSLRQQRWPAYWHIKLPILLRPILYSFATAFAVSVTQYLPTLFVGAGQFTTLTTEAVAMSSGSDRRMMAVMAIWQQSLPLIIFFLATIVPALRFRHRKGMKQR